MIRRHSHYLRPQTFKPLNPMLRVYKKQLSKSREDFSSEALISPMEKSRYLMGKTGNQSGGGFIINEHKSEAEEEDGVVIEQVN